MTTATRILVVVGLAALAGCPFSFTNDEHCAANEGDASCAAADPSTPYCALDGCSLYDEVANRSGCVADLPSDPTCYSPCGGKQNASDRIDCGAQTDGGTVGSSSTSDATGPTTAGTDTASTTEGGCDCSEDQPVCLDGACLGCDDDDDCMTWFEADAERAYCVDRDCVGCTLEIQTQQSTPFFEGCVPEENCDDGSCVPGCLYPGHCPETGCISRDKLCAPPDLAFYVSANPNPGVDPDGSEAAPYPTILQAVTGIGRQLEGDPFRVGTIFLEPGRYEETVEIDSRRVVVRPKDPGAGQVTLAPATGSEYVFDLLAPDTGLGSGILMVQDIHFEGPGYVARVESTARFYGENLEVVGADGVLTLEENGAGYLRNSLITAVSEQAPFVVGPQTELAIVASTIIDNAWESSWFDCADAEPDRQALLDVRSSIVGNVGENVSADLFGPNCNVSVSDTIIDTIDAAWFSGDDYRLNTAAEGGLLIPAVGLCQDGDPLETAPVFVPCVPPVDVDGRDRTLLVNDDGDPVNYAGFCAL